VQLSGSPQQARADQERGDYGGDLHDFAALNRPSVNNATSRTPITRREGLGMIDADDLPHAVTR